MNINELKSMNPVETPENPLPMINHAFQVPYAVLPPDQWQELIPNMGYLIPKLDENYANTLSLIKSLTDYLTLENKKMMHRYENQMESQRSELQRLSGDVARFGETVADITNQYEQGQVTGRRRHFKRILMAAGAGMLFASLLVLFFLNM